MSDAARSETDRAQQSHQGGPHVDTAKLRTVRPIDYLVRFVFGFLISVVAGLVTDVYGPRVGGLFLAFPAILPATVTLVEKKEGIAQAASDIRGATIGALGLVAFGCLVAAFVQRSPALAISGALVGWALVSGLGYLMIRGLAHALGEKQYLPEIPTSDAAVVVGILHDRGLTIATAESCSGGMVAALLAAVPDSGRVFRGGVVAYTDDLKESLLGVSPELLARDGAISGMVAAAMAAGARRVSGADVAIAVSGATGASAEGKPPGLTYIAVATPDHRVRTREFRGDLGPGRNDERAVRMALELARAALTGSTDDVLPGTAVDYGASETFKRPDTVRS
jgi:nicotinamide-nucleotide amidase